MISAQIEIFARPKVNSSLTVKGVLHWFSGLTPHDKLGPSCNNCSDETSGRSVVRISPL
jgi:hypothetical protein